MRALTYLLKMYKIKYPNKSRQVAFFSSFDFIRFHVHSHRYENIFI